MRRQEMALRYDSRGSRSSCLVPGTEKPRGRPTVMKPTEAWFRTRLRAVASCLGVVLLGVASACGKSRPEPVLAETDDVRTELQRSAEKVFVTPGSPLDRGSTARLRRLIVESATDPQRQVQLRFELVESLAKDGAAQAAVEEVEKAFEILKPIPGVLDQVAPHHFRGLAYLRLSEVENCINLHNEECCVFPLQGGGVHALKQPAQ